MTETDGPHLDRDHLHELDRLRRSTDDRYVAGVAGGLGRHFGIDPAIVRVLFVVLAFFGGASIPAYIACWLLVPEEGRERAAVPTGAELRRIVLISAAAVAVLVFLGDAWGGFAWHVWPLLVVGLAVVLVVSRRTERRTASGTPAPAPGAAGEPATAGATSLPVTVPPRRRTGPVLFWPTLALLAIGLGVLGIVATDHSVAPGAWAALAVAIVGAMLVLGAFVGRPGGLLPLGLALVPVLAVTTAVGHTGFSGHEVVFTPGSAAAVSSAYDVPSGSTLLDLSGIADAAALDGRTITVRLDAGLARIVLPRGVSTAVDARIRYAGSVDVDGRQSAGLAPSVETTVPATGPSDGIVHLVVRSRVGRIEIERS
ncbi:MAG: PspC domain-containing protein [Marmoricola sp.]